MNNPIIMDSSLSLEEAIKQNPDMLCPREIITRQSLLDVTYFSFDGKLHKGQIVVDRDLSEDVLGAFSLIREIKFPVASVIPIADPKFLWNDETSGSLNNSSGFNYRNILKTERLSNHSYGKAVDINPKLNPYFRQDLTSPEGAVYDPSIAGTLVASDKIVTFFKERGWEWGGDWTDRKDYQHFQKI